MPLPKEYGQVSETIVAGKLRQSFKIDDIMVFKTDSEITMNDKKYKSILIDRSYHKDFANVLQNVKDILIEKKIQYPTCSVRPYSHLWPHLRLALKSRWNSFSQNNAFNSNSFQ